MEELEEMAGLIVPADVRKLFVRLCEEISKLSDTVSAESTPFEIRFTGPGGFRIAVTPYRELFLVSVGQIPSCDVRVASKEGCISALHLALHHYLETHSECPASVSM